MEFIYDYGLFLAKTITFVLAFAGIVAIIAASAMKQAQKRGELEVTDISEQLKEVEEEVTHHLLSKEALKEKEKQNKKTAKLKAKEAKKSQTDSEESTKPRLFVIDFKGSIDAKEVSALREEITAVLMVAKPQDEVLVTLESGGGMAHCYGLAASQLARIKQANIPLTISVDKVAASGGYMMACVADKIVSAPFAILGSIGVIAQIPNFNKVLKKNDVDFEQLTAGEYKRTLTMFGENTDKGREKFKEELEEMHALFKEHITEHRPALDVESVATGETWLGKKAITVNLIDELIISDDYIYQANQNRKVIGIKYSVKKGLAEKLSKAASLSIDNTISKLWQHNRIFPS
ncbi:protease SohB [Thalassotalea sp. 1_MG-2023]|uniref:protease SohB n=1 Tax=Thalassotalea sp. 1_MG-2023 TaxID=3062680 RepID=UPI0026E2CF99|nr:protease SohB [Thalassotalea sp. 1_MG-2023]MDO6427850.1 protease SohB [Thalassotalea sp. 1_MG-2023]